jgi:Tfp pilus assembly protein PilF
MIPWGVDPVERFEALLAQGKDTPLLRFSLGMQYLKGGDAPRAAAHLRAAVAADPGYSAAWKLLGKALVECGEPQEAAKAYRAGIEVATAKGDKQAAREMGVFLRRVEKGTPPG